MPFLASLLHQSFQNDTPRCEGRHSGANASGFLSNPIEVAERRSKSRIV